jgi:hypothetical protein
LPGISVRATLNQTVHRGAGTGRTSPPVSVHDAAWAARRRALAHEAAADTHERTAGQHDACAERGIGDSEEHRRRAA